jgi:hypothetical protein
MRYILALFLLPVLSFSQRPVPGAGSTGGVSAGVSSLAGTSNEIAVDAATGAVTASLPSTVSLAGKAFIVPSSNTLPATCAVGSIYMDTDATTGQRIYACQATNTWVLQGDGGSASVSGNGMVSNSGGTLTGRTITGASGITITNADGIAGNPTIAPDLSVVAGLAEDNTWSGIQDLSGTTSLRFKFGTAAAASGDCDASTEEGNWYLQSQDGATANSQAYICARIGASTYGWRPMGHFVDNTAPATCLTGQVWFDSNATAGSNWFGCTAANTWTLMSGGSSSTTTKGDVATYSTIPDRLAVGANNTVLTADSAETTGLKWATPEVSTTRCSYPNSTATPNNATTFQDFPASAGQLTGTTLSVGDKVTHEATFTHPALTQTMLIRLTQADTILHFASSAYTSSVSSADGQGIYVKLDEFIQSASAQQSMLTVTKNSSNVVSATAFTSISNTTPTWKWQVRNNVLDASDTITLRSWCVTITKAKP